jgi:HSP20 family molecular chaperone IbpA
VASRVRSLSTALNLRDFASLCDEMFDELLIERWRPNQGERAVAVDLGDSYRVKIATANADPHKMELEVTGNTMRLRVPSGNGTSKHTCRFAHPIDPEQVSASWHQGILQIVLPKRRPRRIAVE